MKKNSIIIVTILFLILQSCTEEDTELIEASMSTKIEDTTKSSTPPLPIKSKDQVVVRFKTNQTPSQKRVLRDSLKVIDYKTCSCGNNDLELWTIDKEAIDVEEVVDNFPPEGDVEGDYQFNFIIENNDNVALGAITAIEDKIAPINAKAVNIAVIDTGVAYDYFEDPFLYYNPDQVSCRPEISGWDFVNDDKDMRDDHGHGTLVTRLITTTMDANNIDYRILPVKAFDKSGHGSYWNLVCATNYVVNKTPSIDVVNMSFGWYTLPEQDIMKSLIHEARKTTLFVASAGNHSINTDGRMPHFPSGYDARNLLTVGGFKPTDAVQVTASGDIYGGIELANKSNYGSSSIDMVAPFRYYILMEPPVEASYKFEAQGTSFSSAFVTAQAAQIFGNNTPYRVKKNLLKSAYFSEEIKKDTQEGKVILNDEKVEQE